MGDVTNVYNNGAIYYAVDLPRQAEVLGRDELSGHTVAWRCLTPGGGWAIVLGFRWSQAMRDHERMLRGLLQRLRLQQKVVCSNPNVWTSLRAAGAQSMLFILNLLSSSMEAEVRCRPAWSTGMIDTGRHALPPMTVKTVELGG